MAAFYLAALLLPVTGSFFELTALDAGLIATAVLAGAVSIGALALACFLESAGTSAELPGG